jgi:hypothetical protein
MMAPANAAIEIVTGSGTATGPAEMLSMPSVATASSPSNAGD